MLPLLRPPAADRILDTAHGIATITTNADNINTAVDRVAKIIFALKSFSRFGGVQVWTPSDLREGLETVLTIYQNQIKHGVELVRQDGLRIMAPALGFGPVDDPDETFQHRFFQPRRDARIRAFTKVEEEFVQAAVVA